MAPKKQPNVCRGCHRVVVIIDPKHSDIAQKMNVDTPGRVALKVR